jgi:hypothetical protein
VVVSFIVFKKIINIHCSPEYYHIIYGLFLSHNFQPLGQKTTSSNPKTITSRNLTLFTMVSSSRIISHQDCSYERGLISCSWEDQERAIRRNRMSSTNKVVIPDCWSSAESTKSIVRNELESDVVREEMDSKQQSQPEMDATKHSAKEAEERNVTSQKQVASCNTLDEPKKATPAVKMALVEATPDATESTAAEEDEDELAVIIVETTMGEASEAALLDFDAQEKYLQRRRASSYRKPQVTIPGGATMSIKERMRLFQAKS